MSNRQRHGGTVIETPPLEQRRLEDRRPSDNYRHATWPQVFSCKLAVLKFRVVAFVILETICRQFHRVVEPDSSS